MGCKVISQHRSFEKNRVAFVLRLPRRGTRDAVHAALCDAPADMRGEIDWDYE